MSLKSADAYENFLRCLSLFNDEVISRSDLLSLVAPFLSRSPDLYSWFKDFVGYNDSGVSPTYDSIPMNIARTERPSEETALEIGTLFKKLPN